MNNTESEIAQKYQGININDLSRRNPQKSCIICARNKCGNHNMANDSCSVFIPATVEQWKEFYFRR